MVDNPKEPSFFVPGHWPRIGDVREYAERVNAAQPGARAVGDASQAYYSHPDSAGILAAFNPEAKFILIYRHPTDRSYSLYNKMVMTGREYLSSFEKALQAEEGRFKSRVFHRYAPGYPWNYFYRRSGLYGEQLERYLCYFPLERFHFLTLDDLVRRTEESLRGIYRHLGVDQSFADGQTLRHDNASLTITRPAAHFLASRKPVRVLSRRSSLVAGAINAQRGAWSQPVRPLSKSVRAALDVYFADDLAVLFRRTGLDLRRSGESASFVGGR